MKKLLSIIFISVIMLSATSADKSIFNKAKLFVFDENWEQALLLLDKLEKNYPESNYLPMTYFYKGKCYEETNKLQNAIKYFEQFIIYSDNDSLSEEAEISIINNSFKLFEKGKDKYLKKITGRLSSFNKNVRYYAAFSLSYANNKKIAENSLNVLKKILFDEEDRDLKERAKLAILRISPKELEKVEKTKSKVNKNSARMFRIRVIDKKNNKSKVSVNIPFSLAELAIKSLPESEKRKLMEKGYDLNTILKTLVDVKEIITIEEEDELIKIWIE